MGPVQTFLCVISTFSCLTIIRYWRGPKVATEKVGYIDRASEKVLLTNLYNTHSQLYLLKIVLCVWGLLYA